MGFLVGLFGSKPKTHATAASGIQMQSSAQGLPVPLVFGTCSVAPNLIWYGDFVATQQRSSAGSGGKGGSSGGKGGGGVTYTYSAAFEFGLCAGPIQGVGNVFVNKQITSLSALGYSLFNGTAGQSPWGYLTSTHPGQDLHYNYLAHIDVSGYNMGTSPQVPNTNIEVQGLFSNSVSQENYGESYVVGQTTPSGGSGNPITVLYAGNWTSDGGVTDVNGNTYTLVGGAPGNLQYNAVAGGVYTFNSAQNGTQIFITYNASIGADADPSLIFNYLLTDPRQGVLFPSANLGSLTTWQAYCIANGLLLSPGYTQQSAASSMITDILTATNSNIVSSGGIVTVVPYGDQSITANGYTYTSPSSPIYSLTDDDFIRVKNQDPVTISRMNPADVYNSINLTCLDRANQYNSAILNAKNQAAIDTYGLRENTVDMRIFANLNAARLSLQLQLHRQEVRNQYSFTTDHRYLLLDPMDIIAITDTVAGINAQWVRILSITEDDNGNFQITAEDYLKGNGSAPLYSLQKGVGYNVNYNIDPGNANVPVIFEPPVQISQTGGIEVDIAVSGGTYWGGADIWISNDGNTYKLAGRVNGPARQGVLNGSLASGSDPDIINTLNVDLTESTGVLNSGTQADADANHTLCYVDGEFISYETATLTAANKYALTYLRRGQFGSTISSHANGTQFARIDGGIFAYSYDKSKIGSTIYIKILSFNTWGGGEQVLSSISAYTHVLTGPPLPGVVSDFTATQQGNVVVFGWTDLQPNDTGLKGYDIAFGIQGSAWAAKELLTEAARGTEMTNAAVPPGTWEFSIRGHDIADNLGAISSVQLIVTNLNTVISSVMQEPLWLGTLNNFLIHWSGILIPLSQHTPAYYAVIAAPPTPTTGTVIGGALGLITYYIKTTYVDATGESIASAEKTQIVPALSLLMVTAPAPSGLAIGWNVYVSTSSGAETLQNSSPIAFATNWTEPTTGLVAGTALPTNNTTGMQPFNEFVPDPVSSASYTAPTVDTGYNEQLRIYDTSASSLGMAQSGAAASLTFEIDTWLTGQSDPGIYQPWTVGLITTRYLSARLLYSPINAGDVSYVTDFTPVIDNAPTIEQANSVNIAAGGTAITFPTPYHLLPFVQVTAIGSMGQYASAAAITTNGFQGYYYSAGGTSTAGQLNWTSTGE